MDKKLAEQFNRTRLLQVGDKGRLVDFQCKVIQVVSPTVMIAGVYRYVPSGAPVPRGIRPEEDCVIDVVCIADYDTSHLIDNRLHETEEWFEVTGTYSYHSADTLIHKVPLLKPIKMQTK